MNYCKNCGNKLESGMKFCSHCGFQLEVYPMEDSHVNQKPKKKFGFFKCILSCIGISFALSFVTSFISILCSMNNFSINLSFIQITLPILIIIFGPIILYIIKNR